MNETIFDRVKDLAYKKGVSISRVEGDLDFGDNYLYKWKRAAPNTKSLIKVAKYFNVSTDYLLFGKEENAPKDEKIDLKEAIENKYGKMFSYGGKDISQEDLAVIKRILDSNLK